MELPGLWGSEASWGSSVNLYGFKSRKVTLHMRYLKPGIYLTYITVEINGIPLFLCNKFSTKPFGFLSIITFKTKGY